MRSLLATAFCLLTIVQANADAGTALSAVEALPIKYKHGVIKISADNGDPEPPQWYFVAKNSDRDDVTYSITVVQGQITAEKPTLDLRALIRDAAPINFSRVTLDSAGAWAIAEKYVTANGKKLGSVSYALQQQGRDATPIWSVWCYDLNTRYLGLLQILATDGTVISSEGLSKP